MCASRARCTLTPSGCSDVAARSTQLVCVCGRAQRAACTAFFLAANSRVDKGCLRHPGWTGRPKPRRHSVSGQGSASRTTPRGGVRSGGSQGSARAAPSCLQPTGRGTQTAGWPVLHVPRHGHGQGMHGAERNCGMHAILVMRRELVESISWAHPYNRGGLDQHIRSLKREEWCAVPVTRARLQLSDRGG